MSDGSVDASRPPLSDGSVDASRPPSYIQLAPVPNKVVPEYETIIKVPDTPKPGFISGPPIAPKPVIIKKDKMTNNEEVSTGDPGNKMPDDGGSGTNWSPNKNPVDQETSIDATKPSLQDKVMNENTEEGSGSESINKIPDDGDLETDEI